MGGGSVKPSLHEWKVLAATATNLINLIAHFCLLDSFPDAFSSLGLRVLAESLNSVLLARDLPFLQRLLFAAPNALGLVSVHPDALRMPHLGTISSHFDLALGRGQCKSRQGLPFAVPLFQQQP